jgi:molecular chaperone GrpE
VLVDLEMKKSEKKIDKGTEKSEELKNQLIRALADYDNLRKRIETERELWIKFSTERVLVKMIPVLDTLESAQMHLGDQGLAITISEFKKVLGEEEIEEIQPNVGDKFDHSLHEAIESVIGGEKGKIADVVLNGWKFKEGKIIRYAKVKVYSDDIVKN